MPQTYTIEKGLPQEQILHLKSINRLCDSDNGIIRYRGFKFSSKSESEKQNGLIILPGLMKDDEVRSKNIVYINMREPKKAPPEYVDNVFYYKDSSTLSESTKKPNNKFVFVLARNVYSFKVEEFVHAPIHKCFTEQGKMDVLLFFPSDRMLLLCFTKGEINEEFPFI